MKRLFFVTLLFLLFFQSCTSAKPYSREEVVSKLIPVFLKNYHYSKLKLNDAFSRKVFGLYLKRLDYQKKFLTKQDIQKLGVYQNRLDDQFKRGRLDFFEQSTSLLKDRTKKVLSFYSNMLVKPFNFKKKEGVVLNYDHTDFPADDQALQERWRKILKYQVLNRYLSRTQKSNQNVFYPVIEKDAREGVMKQVERSLKRQLEKKKLDSFQLYMNAFANVYDPHTVYMAPKMDQDFNIEMTGTLEGIGAVLTEDNGYIKVLRIVPGSAAWREKELKAEDIILKVAQGDGEPVDIVEMPVGDAVMIIRGKKGTEVRLTVKKPDGRIVVIPIVRDKVVLEETYAKSAVIEDKGQKIGYIDLPVFYRDFNNPNGRASSTDVEKELKKLIAQNVDGVILDLRDNGGGALDDAVRLAGLFIDRGPVVQVRNRNGGVRVLEDVRSGSVYDGPLIVLVSKLSASASEIVSAALQDYGRAVVVGGQQTYGKGTVQSYINLDEQVRPALNSLKPFGAFKMTVQKFYRINGGSTQFKGVSPDIILPDLYDALDIGEQTVDFALPWDEIQPQNYQKWNDLIYNISNAIVQSHKRVNTNRIFSLMHSNSILIRQQQDQITQTLNLAKFVSEYEKIKKRNKIFAAEAKKEPLLSIETSEPETKQTQNSAVATVEKAKKEQWLKKLRQDVALHEAVSIMKDIKK